MMRFKCGSSNWAARLQSKVEDIPSAVVVSSSVSMGGAYSSMGVTTGSIPSDKFCVSTPVVGRV